MNQMIKTSLEENPSSASSKAISCKLAQREFLQLFMRKDFVMDGRRRFVGSVGNSFPFV
jgi:hypothetical protein